MLKSLIKIAVIISIFLFFLSCDLISKLKETKIVEIEVEKNCEIVVRPVEKIYMHKYGNVGDPYREDLHGDIRCSCIRSARSFGADIPSETDAINLEPNTGISLGVVVIFLTDDKEVRHVAVVTNIEEEGFWVKEGNYVKCEITERYISFDDHRIIGFYEESGTSVK